MTALSRELTDLITQACGCSHWACDDTKKELERAAKADNTASSLQSLRAAEANLAHLLHHVHRSLEVCERGMRSEEETPPDPLSRTMALILRAGPRRFRVVQ